MPNRPPATTSATDAPATGIVGPGRAEHPSPWGAVPEEIQTLLSFRGYHELPWIAGSQPPADETQVLEAIAKLRRFHINGAEDTPTSKSAKTDGEGLLPALLAPFRDISRVRYSYPLFLFPPGEQPQKRLCVPLAELLTELLESVDPAGQARILRDNLPRFEVYARKMLPPKTPPQDAVKLLGEAAEQFPKLLQLRKADAATFIENTGKLLAALPPGGRLIGYSDGAALLLLIHMARHVIPIRRRRFRKQVESLRTRLEQLLDVEHNKSAEAHQPQALQEAMGDVGSQIMDMSALSRVMGNHRGSQTMPPGRRERIEGLVKWLDAYIKGPEAPLVTMVTDMDLPRSAIGEAGIRFVKHADPCQAAMGLFDEHAAQMAQVVRAVRAAELEITDAYKPDLHDSLFNKLEWDGFTREELLLVPPVVARQRADKLSQQIGSVSTALSSGRPIKIIAVLWPASTGPSDARNGTGFRVELGLLAMSFRKAVVHQTSAAHPEQLLRGLVQGFDSTRGALHVVAVGKTLTGEEAAIEDWFYIGAAVEGRAHPYFLYDPEAGRGWALRFNLSLNSEPEQAWPTGSMFYRTVHGTEESLSTTFTFADFALLDPGCRSEFSRIPAGVPDDNLITVDAYTQLRDLQTSRKVPFLWAVDVRGELQRLAVSRRLAMACRDRQGAWRTLQEMAGYNSEHVRRAQAQAQAEAKAQLEAAQTKMEIRLQNEVETARANAAGEAMERLAASLLETDLKAISQRAVVAAPPTGPAPTTAATPERETESKAEKGDEDDGISFDEPWVDTPLCTSCNDCVTVNPKLFVYDAEKQATIGDPHAGTYAELVAVAESCPARAIHPGKPLNPDEPDLDALIKRAERFN